MNQIPEEECPICWRSFSNNVSPMTLICGHSLCEDCSEDLKKCPLCRRKLQSGYARATNYSLVSLIDKLEAVEKKEYKDQEVQTEKQKRSYSTRQSHGFKVEGNGHSLALSAIMKLTKVQQMLALTFKLNLNHTTPN